jgi:hypothetical protein
MVLANIILPNKNFDVRAHSCQIKHNLYQVQVFTSAWIEFFNNKGDEREVFLEVHMVLEEEQAQSIAPRTYSLSILNFLWPVLAIRVSFTPFLVLVCKGFTGNADGKKERNGNTE